MAYLLENQNRPSLSFSQVYNRRWHWFPNTWPVVVPGTCQAQKSDRFTGLLGPWVSPPVRSDHSPCHRVRLAISAASVLGMFPCLAAVTPVQAARTIRLIILALACSVPRWTIAALRPIDEPPRHPLSAGNRGSAAPPHRTGRGSQGTRPRRIRPRAHQGCRLAPRGRRGRGAPGGCAPTRATPP